MGFLRNGVNFHCSERQIILSGARKPVLDIKQYTDFEFAPSPKKNPIEADRRQLIPILANFCKNTSGCTFEMFSDQSPLGLVIIVD